MATSLSEKFFTAGEELVETGQRYIDNIGVTAPYEDSSPVLRMIDSGSLLFERGRIGLGRATKTVGQALKALHL